MVTTIRTYVALTPQQAQALAETRQLSGDVRGFAPMPDLAGAELEEAEFEAAQVAARNALVHGLSVAVAALELPSAAVQANDDGPGAALAQGFPSVRAVAVPEPVALSRVAALHMADDTLEGQALSAESAEPIELSWYDTTEIHHVVQLLTADTN